MVRPLLALVVVLAPGVVGCRLIAGINDIELEADSGKPGDGGADVGKDAVHDAVSDSGGPCACDNCVVLATEQDLPLGIQLDTDGTLYWINFGSGKGTGGIFSMPKTGGKPKQVVGGLTQAYGLQIDSNNLYWAALDTAGTSGQIVKMPKKGGAAVTLAKGQPNPVGELVQQGVSNLPTQQFLAVSDTTVYYVTFDSAGDQSAVWQVPIDGSDFPSAFLANLPGEGGIGLIQGYAITLFGSSLYVICDTPAFDGLIEAPLSGAPIKELVSDLNYPVALAVTSSQILWCDDEANFANGFVDVAPLSGATFKSVGKGLAAPWSLVTDDTMVYWVNNGNATDFGSIQKAPLNGSSAAVSVVPNAYSPEALVMDDTSLYWVDSTCGGVLKTAK
jgi:hypothetical protein